jgi:hypothetical protein
MRKMQPFNTIMAIPHLGPIQRENHAHLQTPGYHPLLLRRTYLPAAGNTPGAEKLCGVAPAILDCCPVKNARNCSSRSTPETLIGGMSAILVPCHGGITARFQAKEGGLGD